MAESERAVPPGILKADPDWSSALGHVAFARGQYGDAIGAFQQARDDMTCMSCGYFDLAQTYTKIVAT